MAISVNCATKVITVPRADLGLISAGLYELSIESFRLWLKDWEDSEVGMAMPDTHRRNAPVTLAGATYAQTFEVINGYTVTFEDVGSPYTVVCVGANHNLGDVKTVNQVSLIVGNSAGLIQVATGAGPTAEEVATAVRAALTAELQQVTDVARIHGLVSGQPLVVTPSSRVAGPVTQAIDTAGDTVTVTRGA